MLTLLLVGARHFNKKTEVFSRTPEELWLMIADKLLQPVTVKIKESKEKEKEISAVVSGAAAEAGAEAEESVIVAGSKVVSPTMLNEIDVNTMFWKKSACKLKITASLFKGKPPQKRTEIVEDEKGVLIARAC